VSRESGRVGCIEIGRRKALAFVTLTGNVDDQNADEEQQRRDGSEANPPARPQCSPSKHHEDSEGIRVKCNMLVGYGYRRGPGRSTEKNSRIGDRNYLSDGYEEREGYIVCQQYMLLKAVPLV
jgi:hypothetical protein